MFYIKNNILIPLVLLVLGIVFAFISFLVFITKGNPFFVKKKLRVGAIILTLTALISTGFSSCAKRTCYSIVIQENGITLNAVMDTQNGIYNIDLTESNIITGDMMNISGKDFFFKIHDNNGTIMQEGKVVPKDGELNNTEEEIEITIDYYIPSGVYNLIFLNSDKLEIGSFNLQIENEEVIMCYEIAF